jgi:hypothetical protein
MNARLAGRRNKTHLVVKKELQKLRSPFSSTPGYQRSIPSSIAVSRRVAAELLRPSMRDHSLFIRRLVVVNRRGTG